MVVSGGGNLWSTEINWAVAVPDGKGSSSSMIYVENEVRHSREREHIPLACEEGETGRLWGRLDDDGI